MSKLLQDNMSNIQQDYDLDGYDKYNNHYILNNEVPQVVQQEQQEQQEQFGGKKLKAKKVKVVKGPKVQNKWLVHVANVKAANPEMSYKEVLVHAKESYIKL